MGGFDVSYVIRFLCSYGWLMARRLDLDDRYDNLTEFQIFNITWCLWDYSEFSCIRVFSFLSISDLSVFCCTTYCISVELVDILEELDRYREHIEDERRGI